MKSTGIVRRIDELGRVVIPKELRRTMHIKEGEEMEVFVDPEGHLILKKFSQVKLLEEYAQELCEIIAETTDCNCLVCDNDTVIAIAKERSVYLGKPISKALEQRFSQRKSIYLRRNESVNLINLDSDNNSMALSPVIFNGDVIGGVVIFGESAGEFMQKITQITANFLARQAQL